MDIEKKYSELKKKYALPELNKLRKDLGFWKLEEEENILKEIRKKIDEKIELFVKILSRMLQPDTVITDMQESAMFSENEKREMFELYKKLMIMHNSSLLLEISSDEKKEAEFIAETAKEWDSIKKKMTNVVENMKESWRKEIKLTDDIGYLG